MREKQKLQTKRVKSQEELKKIYETWWTALQLSEPYETFCEIMEMAINLYGKKEFLSLYEIAEREFADARKKNFSNIPADVWALEENWQYFGNVHKTSFEQWWEQKKSSFTPLPVLDLSDPTCLDLLTLDMAVLRFRRDHKNECPSEEEILRMLTGNIYYVFIAVPRQGLSIDEIRKEIIRIRNKQGSLMPHLQPELNKGKIHIKDIKEYLKLYKMVRKEHVSRSDLKSKYPTYGDYILEYLAKAEKIIRNVENATFPGDYQ